MFFLKKIWKTRSKRRRTSISTTVATAAIQESQLELLAKPYLRPFNGLNETDLNSYQAFVDVFVKEGVLKEPMDVREKILKLSDFGT